MLEVGSVYQFTWRFGDDVSSDHYTVQAIEGTVVKVLDSSGQATVFNMANHTFHEAKLLLPKAGR